MPETTHKKNQEEIAWGIWPSRQSFILSVIIMGLFLGFFHQWFEMLIEKPPDFFLAFYRGLPIKMFESFLKLVPLLLPYYLFIREIRALPPWKRSLLFIFLAVDSTILEELITYYLPVFSMHRFDTESSLFLVLLSFDMLGDIFIFLGILAGLGYMDYVLCRNHILLTNLAEEKARLIEEERLRLIAELKALQAQINPHFLFNTLNSLATLVVTSPDEAGTLVKDLSDWYRNILGSTQQASWAIRDEINLIHNYLKIESVRLGERLTYEIQCSAKARDIAIPPLILQPLVENAVKHAVAPSLSGGTISIGIDGNPRSFRITVADRRNGDELVLGNHNDPGAGAGIENVKRRLALAFSGQARFTLKLKRDGGIAEITVDREDKNGS
ncbi:MAG: sensor histidine kinase [Nitrospiria bacterium]